MRNLVRLTPLAAVILAFASPPSRAEGGVYKCVVGGRTLYSENPLPKGGHCEPTVIRDDGPKPEELARLLEEKQRRQEEDRKAREAELKEREIRTKELEAEAAARRARAEELRLRQRPVTGPTQNNGYPYYWGGGLGIPPGHPPQQLPGQMPPPGNGMMKPPPGRLRPMPPQQGRPPMPQQPMYPPSADGNPPGSGPNMPPAEAH
jgi:hypothetical protein